MQRAPGPGHAYTLMRGETQMHVSNYCSVLCCAWTCGHRIMKTRSNALSTCVPILFASENTHLRLPCRRLKH
jgi:hypothetical protein